MEAREIIAIASRWMGDEGGSAWNEPDMLGYLQVALHALFDARPDLLLGSSGLTDQDTVIEALEPDTDMLSYIPGRRYGSALAHKICQLCYTEDADSTVNERLGALHLALFEREIQ